VKLHLVPLQIGLTQNDVWERNPVAAEPQRTPGNGQAGP
jgi:hypothetical protein